MFCGGSALVELSFGSFAGDAASLHHAGWDAPFGGEDRMLRLGSPTVQNQSASGDNIATASFDNVNPPHFRAHFQCTTRLKMET